VEDTRYALLIRDRTCDKLNSCLSQIRRSENMIINNYRSRNIRLYLAYEANEWKDTLKSRESVTKPVKRKKVGMV
jgi:hypothetical protein